MIEKLGMALMRRMDAEVAHGLALKALHSGLAPLPGVKSTPRLRTRIAGLDLPNPVGLAAGFDKNAKALAPLARAGFGFIEVGAATPRPQAGNAKPRLFRLTEDRAAINRFGFNNDGMEAIGARLAARSHNAVVGLNLGANKDSDDRADDFARVLTHCGPHVEFATVNVSSPNTENLRDLQGKAALSALLAGVMEAREALPSPIPVFLKIAPDLTLHEIDDICDVALNSGISGIIATNTTKERAGLQSMHKNEMGGLSGAPLFEMSTRVLAQVADRCGTSLPIIGVGGVSTGAEAYAKIRAGASAVQLYTSLVYGGLSLAGQIIDDLDQRLANDGFASVANAVGTGKSDWL